MWKTGWEDSKQEEVDGYKEMVFSSTAGQRYIKIHGIYDSMLKTCADSSQTKIPAWGGEAGKASP